MEIAIITVSPYKYHKMDGMQLRFKLKRCSYFELALCMKKNTET